MQVISNEMSILRMFKICKVRPRVQLYIYHVNKHAENNVGQIGESNNMSNLESKAILEAEAGTQVNSSQITLELVEGPPLENNENVADILRARTMG